MGEQALRTRTRSSLRSRRSSSCVSMDVAAEGEYDSRALTRSDIPGDDPIAAVPVPQPAPEPGLARAGAQRTEMALHRRAVVRMKQTLERELVRVVGRVT